MGHLTRKIIAILMLLWMPLFTANALAASVSMQLPQGVCHGQAIGQDMALDEMNEHNQMGSMSVDDDHELPCTVCGICHLACTGYLYVPVIELQPVQTSANSFLPYQVAYQSITLPSLVPPPSPRV